MIKSLSLWIIVIVVVVLVEAFGSGPSYYGLTTNLDKWHKPVPYMLVIKVFVQSP